MRVNVPSDGQERLKELGITNTQQCKEKVRKEKQLTEKVKHAAVLATDKPFLVNCKGPSFMITYEQPPKDMGRLGKPVIAGGGVLNWTSEGTPSDPNPNIMNRIPESNNTLPN